MSERSFRVAVVGATGLVGGEILGVLEERACPISELVLYAADDAVCAEVEFAGESRRVEELPAELPEVDVAFLCALPEVAEPLGERLAEKGTLVIDLEGGAAGVVLGPADVSAAEAKQPLRLADPAARLLVGPLRALAEVGPVRRAHATLVLPSSAFGRGAVESLGNETIALMNARGGGDPDAEDDDETEDSDAREVTAAFRCAPVDPKSGLAARIQAQSESLLGASVALTIQALRAPIFFGQMASLSVEMAAPVDIEAVRKALHEAPSLILIEGEVSERSTSDALGIDAVQVSGLRHDTQSPCWLHFWALSDNVRQGAALPAVSLAEGLLLRN